MTQDEIMEMAKQAGFDIGMWEKLSDDDDVFGYEFEGIHENLEAFAKLVAEKELTDAQNTIRQLAEKLECCKRLVDSINMASNPMGVKSREALRNVREMKTIMTKEEEILLRELAGGRCTIQKVTAAIGPMSLWSKDGLEAEIRKAVEAEREACAKVCEDLFPTYLKAGERWLKGRNGKPDSRLKDLAPNLEAAWEAEQLIKHGSVIEKITEAHSCANAIRARGQA